MTTASLPVPRISPRDLDQLERRARELASGEAEAAGPGGARPVVVFRLSRTAFAVETAAVQRAIPRLAGVLPVPVSAGIERAVAFVEDRPLPVADLAGFAAGAPRRVADLAGSPALVVAAPEGEVLLAVDGPLALSEEGMTAGAAFDPGEGRVRITGRLESGAQLLDAAWLLEWARRAVRP